MTDAVKMTTLEMENQQLRKLLWLNHGCNITARAEAARLRAALEEMLCKPEPGQVAPCPCRRCHIALAALASAPSVEPEGPDYSGLCSAPECGGHCGYVHARGCEAIREYLADHGGAPYKAPSRASATPRDMRVAEAVRKDMRKTALAAYHSGCMLEDASEHISDAMLERDLAAVVAKAVGT